MHGTDHDLIARLDRLERINRGYRRALTVLGLALAAAVTVSMSQDDPVPEVIRTRSLEVVDEQGRALVHLFSTMGIGAIATSDEEGNPLVALLAERAGEERVGVVTALSSDGQPPAGTARCGRTTAPATNAP
jgi:hypothetical protein